jgi:hypothetical protein
MLEVSFATTPSSPRSQTAEKSASPVREHIRGHPARPSSASPSRTTRRSRYGRVVISSPSSRSRSKIMYVNGTDFSPKSTSPADTRPGSSARPARRRPARRRAGARTGDQPAPAVELLRSLPAWEARLAVADTIPREESGRSMSGAASHGSPRSSGRTPTRVAWFDTGTDREARLHRARRIRSRTLALGRAICGGPRTPS